MAKKGNDDSKLWAFLGVFLTLIGFILVLLVKKDDKYAMYYAKHGLVLFIAWVVVGILSWIPVVGFILYIVGAILLLIAWIAAFVGALSGEMKRFPVLSDMADKFNF